MYVIKMVISLIDFIDTKKTWSQSVTRSTF